MPREHSKSKRGARNHGDLSRKTKLTPSQRAFIAHFASLSHSTKRLNLALPHATSSVKLEVEASTTHYSPTLQLLCKVKEEAPPLAHAPLPTNLLAPPIIKPGDPYYGDGSCQAEEEIPPLARTPKDDSAEDKEAANQAQHFSDHLVEEHINILFKIRQRQADQEHSQRILSQRMDILFEVLSDAPTHAKCLTCSQRFVPAYNIHGQPAPAAD